jgi:DNA-binding beta-propeller fold protein YncE
VRRVAADGTVSTLAGSDAAGFLDGPVAAARFQEPTSLAVDEHGTVFVADPFNHRVRRIAPDDHGELAVATLVGGDAAGSQDGPPAAFDHPYALALDGRHRLFVAERFGQTLRMITLDATGRATAVRTVAGAYEQAGAADGVGAAARFSRPVALAWDPRVADHTALYVAGDLRCALRRVDVDAAGVATVTTLNGADASCGYADGAIGAMRFDRPQALLVDPARGLLLADAGNQALRLVANAVSTPLGGPGKPPFQGPAGLALAPGGGLYVADGNRVRRVAF